MLNSRKILAALGLGVLLGPGLAARPGPDISLAGTWRFALGTPAPVFPQGPLPAIAFADTIALPGTTETRGKGPENPARETRALTRLRLFDGAAWYQRDVDIPADWRGRWIELSLERTKYTQVWFDDHPVGEQGLYTAPQHYDLTAVAAPGRHRLTIMVDNRTARRAVVTDSHQFTDHTQTDWNGIIGQIALVARPAVWIDEVRVTSDLARRSFHLHIDLGRLSGAAAPRRITVRAESFNHDGPPHRPPGVDEPIPHGDGPLQVEMELPLGAGARLWDEFTPAQYRLTVTLDGPAGRDERIIETGLREFRTRDGQFTINGRTTFLRGKHDACVFPLTGHPPMDVDGWLAYFRIVQSYGLNHIRFHSWTPPEAAFTAADRLGLYLQPELPFWGKLNAKARDFLVPEGAATLRAYGHHPSFVMFTLGNELMGSRPLAAGFVAQLRAINPDLLYASGTNAHFTAPALQPGDDFWVTMKTRVAAGGVTRGSFANNDSRERIVQWGEPGTRADFRAALAGVPVPVVGHEIGQYTVYPDFREIARYTGVTRARNLEQFRESLARHGMLDQAPDFFRASGALAASLYREEIELALRTPGFGGFQLLDLQDYPGQGTALIGMLDAFMESKGFIKPAEWSHFCGPIVPLARFDRYTWTTADTFRADLELAHYGPADLAGAVTTWTLVSGGDTLAGGSLPPATLRQGGLRPVGQIGVDLSKVMAPARAEFTVTVDSGGRVFTNHWPLWVYPESPGPATPPNVTVVHDFDAATKRLLAAGRRVVLMPNAEKWPGTIDGGYSTDFWSWPLFHEAPGTMGLLCDPRHPALRGFPTEYHSERQWTRIAQAATPVMLTGLPPGLRPIVQVIDNLARNEKLGLVFELRVGAGALLVCASDLDALAAVPEARQLRASLLAYAASLAFAPATAVAATDLDRLFRPRSEEEKRP